MENVTFYMEEFRICNGQRVPISSDTESIITSPQYHSAQFDFPEPEQAHARNQLNEDAIDATSDDEDTDQPIYFYSDAIKLARVTGTTEIRVTMKVFDKSIIDLLRYVSQH